MLKQKTKIRLGLASLALTLFSVSPYFCPVSASESNTTFEVNVKESLAVTITTPTSGATGDINTFLRNAVVLDIFSNNSSGFTATMTMKTTDTSLNHTSKDNTSIPTLSSSTTRSAFPTNYWGYSTDDNQAGNDSSTYSPLVSSSATTPISIFSGSTGSDSETIYFGTKVDGTKPSGTYSGTVVISVVTGSDTINSNTPTDQDTSETNPNCTYNSSTNTTVYTSTSSDETAGTDTKTTVVSEGDTRATYEDPQGVRTVSNISSGSGLATGLAVTASIAAASGIFFFILAKRDDDDDEEDEENV